MCICYLYNLNIYMRFGDDCAISECADDDDDWLERANDCLDGRRSEREKERD